MSTKYQFDSVSEEIYRIFLEFASDCGYRFTYNMNEDYYQWIIIYNDKTLGGNDKYYSHSGTKVSIKDAFRIVAGFPVKFCENVILNDKYTATVFKDKVVVDCQTIPLDKVREILKVAESL